MSKKESKWTKSDSGTLEKEPKWAKSGSGPRGRGQNGPNQAKGPSKLSRKETKCAKSGPGTPEIEPKGAKKDQIGPWDPRNLAKRSQNGPNQALGPPKLNKKEQKWVESGP